mgnify:FL=1
MSDELIVNDKQAMSALKQHGNKIVWAVILVLAGYFGWDFYQKNYAKIDTAAADSYTLITEKNDVFVHQADKEALARDQQALFADIDKLVANHGKTAYAWQALMIKARHQSDNGQHTEAATTLKQASQIDLDDEGLTAITQLRLGQSLLAAGNADEALTVVNGEFPKAFESSKQELLGDIYVLKNDNDNAKQAYQLAWDGLTERGESRSLLSLKMQALGMTPTPITPKHQVVATPVQADADVTSANAQTVGANDVLSDESETVQGGGE